MIEEREQRPTFVRLQLCLVTSIAIFVVYKNTVKGLTRYILGQTNQREGKGSQELYNHSIVYMIHAMYFALPVTSIVAVGLLILISTAVDGFALSKMREEMDLWATKLHNSVSEVVSKCDVKKLIENGPVPKDERTYAINGWRWHTKSVLRDLDRFAAVVSKVESKASRLNNNSDSDELLSAGMRTALADRVKSCFEFVCNFNWRALQRVEKELFHPWLKQISPPSAHALFDDILVQHQQIQQLTVELSECCTKLVEQTKRRDDTSDSRSRGNRGRNSDSNNNNNTDSSRIDNACFLEEIRGIKRLIVRLRACLVHLQQAQDDVFIPYVAAYISEKEQVAFGNRVVTKLGLLDSQVHLVSMSEAIQESPEEIALYRKEIPSVALSLIPIWKNRLYRPRTACLEGM